MPQKQTFTNVTPIQSAPQTFSNVTPINQEEPGFLDKEIPLDSTLHATESGLQSIGRGVRGAIYGGWNALKTAGQAWNDPKADVGDAVLPDPHLEQVPGAIKDINASPDPAGTYAKVGQETAGQGAGAALTALATEGAGRVPAGKLAESMKVVAAPAAEAASKLPVVDKLVSAGKTFGKYKNVPGQLADIWGKRMGSELGDIPPTGAKSAADTGEALGDVPIRRGQLAGQMQESVQKPVQRGSIKQMMTDLETGVGKGLGASPPPNPKAPIYQRGSLAQAMQEGTPDMPEGHTPVQSSWIKSYKYDPATREFEMAPKSGTPVRLGDVSPEEAQAFGEAKSQGKAWQQIKNNVLVAKRITGKWIDVKPTR